MHEQVKALHEQGYSIIVSLSANSLGLLPSLSIIYSKECY